MKPPKGEKWIYETINNTLLRISKDLDEKINSKQDYDQKWTFKLENFSSRPRAQTRIAQIVLIKKHLRGKSYATISDGGILAPIILDRSELKAQGFLNPKEDLEGLFIEIFDCTLNLNSELESPNRMVLDTRKFRILRNFPLKISGQPIELHKIGKFKNIFERLDHCIASSVRKSKNFSLAITQVKTSSPSEEICHQSKDQFATQVPLEHSKRLEPKKTDHKDPCFSKENLLNLLDLDQHHKKLPTIRDVQDLRPNLKPVLRSAEKSRRLVSTLRQTNQEKKLRSRNELHDKISASGGEAHNSEKLQEVSRQRVNENIINGEVFVDNSHQYTINTSLNRTDYLFEEDLRIPYRYICIPSEQKVLLEEQDSWFQSEDNFSCPYARIPIKVSKQLNLFLFQKTKYQEINLYDPCSTQCAPKSTFQPNYFNSHFKRSQYISRQYFRIPNDQKAILEDPCSWFSAETDPSNHYARIPLEVYQNYISFLQVDLSSYGKIKEHSQNSKKKSENGMSNLVDEDQESHDDNEKAQLEVFRPYDERCYNSFSPTPELTSRAASIHDMNSEDPRTQNLDDLHSPKIYQSQAGSHEINLSAVHNSERSFYWKFRSVYSEYSGSRRDFTWALVYIEWLLPQQKLDWEIWDDFVRVLASEYPNDIRSRKNRITGLEYFKMAPRQVLFSRKVIRPENLQLGLLSLNETEVNNFREVFRAEPKESVRNDITSQTARLSESRSETSLKFSGINRSTSNPTNLNECREEPSSKYCPNEFNKEENPLQSTYERTCDCPEKIHLHAWRQFLRKRKMVGTLRTIGSNKITTKRHCTFRRREHNNQVMRGYTQ